MSRRMKKAVDIVLSGFVGLIIIELIFLAVRTVSSLFAAAFP